MSLDICCATLSRLLVLLYRWRSGHTFTPGFSKDVKFVCFSVPPKRTYQKEDVCCFTWKIQVSMVFHFEPDPFLRFFPRTRCQYHRAWWYTTQHSALAQKPQSGNMLCSSSETWGQSWKTSVLFHNCFSCFSLQCIGITMHGTSILLDVTIFNTWAWCQSTVDWCLMSSGFIVITKNGLAGNTFLTSGTPVGQEGWQWQKCSQMLWATTP